MVYLADNDFKVIKKDVPDTTPYKVEHQVPYDLYSCHTALVDGYVVEGHVPVDAIQRLLEERPDALGIGVGGMPIGSPGMEVESGEIEPYDVYLFDESGVIEVWASYP
jgi:hypothetical protein